MVGWMDRISRIVRLGVVLAVDFGRDDGLGIPSNRSFTARLHRARFQSKFNLQCRETRLVT